MRTTFFGIVCLFVLAASQTARAAEITTEKDIVYGKADTVELKLDMARPKEGKGPFPAIVCIHGGGWKAGDRSNLATLIKTLAGKGYVAVTISYRLTPKAKFPAQVHDCKAAVRWLRANAKKYSINPDKIGAIGFSAGGHLVCMLGVTTKDDGLEGKNGNEGQSSAVQAVVSFFGPTDFRKKTWNDTTEKTYLVPFFGDTHEKAKEMYAKGSPLKYVKKGAPPFQFFHGEKDTLVGLHNSVDLAKALRKVGVDAEANVMAGEGHGWGGDTLKHTLDLSIKFFDKHLKK
jgi:acetyl esterase/lipase